jgi:hypothetical protein
MTSRRTRAVSRNTIFGPPPILECENSAGYERLLDRLYADLKPTDIIEEASFTISLTGCGNCGAGAASRSR